MDASPGSTPPSRAGRAVRGRCLIVDSCGASRPHLYAGGMRLIARFAVVVVALFGFVACSETTVTADDAYKIGCPAVGTAVAGGGIAAKATVAGLKKLSASGPARPRAAEAGWMRSSRCSRPTATRTRRPPRLKN